MHLSHLGRRLLMLLLLLRLLLRRGLLLGVVATFVRLHRRLLRLGALVAYPPVVCGARPAALALERAQTDLERIKRRLRAVLQDDLLEAVAARAQRPIPGQRLPTAQSALHIFFFSSSTALRIGTASV